MTYLPTTDAEIDWHRARATAQANEVDAWNARLAASGLWHTIHTNGNHTVWQANHVPDMTMCVSRCDEYMVTTSCYGVVTQSRLEDVIIDPIPY